MNEWKPNNKWKARYATKIPYESNGKILQTEEGQDGELEVHQLKSEEILRDHILLCVFSEVQESSSFLPELKKSERKDDKKTQ